MKISVIGAGYVGLTQAAGLAYIHKHHVMCCDINAQRIMDLNAGKVPIHEPGLDVWIKACYERGKAWTNEGIHFKNQPGEFKSHPMPDRGTLFFTSALGEAAAWGDVIFICVGTPPRADGSVDLSALAQLKDALWALDIKDKVIIVKSTVPPGTTKGMFKDFPQGKGIISYAMNPEFLREGYACFDFENPDRIIIGYEYISLGSDWFRQIYGGAHIETCTTTEAEFTKYASNAFLSMKISFAHEVQDIAVKYKADPLRILELVGKDSRIGDKFLHPGIGYGGSCFPKDTLGYVHIADAVKTDCKLIDATIEINEAQIPNKARYVCDLINNLGLSKSKIGILGTAFKEDTDDIRESKAIAFIRYIAGTVGQLKVYDPKAIYNTINLLGNVCAGVTYHDQISQLDDCDIYIVLTPWAEFVDYLGPKQQPIIDLRNIPGLLRARGHRSDPNYFRYGD